jgi:hypothetical protein
VGFGWGNGVSAGGATGEPIRNWAGLRHHERVVEFFREITGAGRPAVWVLRQTAHHHLLQFGRHAAIGAGLRERRRRFGGVREQHVHRFGTNERQPARQQLKEDHADAVHVAAKISRIAADLLGRDVTRRADREIKAGMRRLLVQHRLAQSIVD